MKLRIILEGHLYVDDEWEELKDKPWDSGVTPQQVLMHITKGMHPELKDSYDVETTKWAMEQFRLADGAVPRKLAVVVDYDYDIVDGFHRLTAAKILGINEIPYREL